jgi:hypothetical protein
VGDGVQFAADGVGSEAGAEEAAIEGGDFVVRDLFPEICTAGEFEFALYAEADRRALGFWIGRFGDGSFDVGVGDAAGAEVTGDAEFALTADFGALAGELLGVAGVVDHAVFAEAGEHDLSEEFTGGAALEESFHFGDGVRAAHQGALSGFVQFGFGVELAGLSEHEGRIEEMKKISHRRTETQRSEDRRGRIRKKGRALWRRAGKSSGRSGHAPYLLAGESNEIGLGNLTEGL